MSFYYCSLTVGRHSCSKGEKMCSVNTWDGNNRKSQSLDGCIVNDNSVVLEITQIWESEIKADP